MKSINSAPKKGANKMVSCFQRAGKLYIKYELNGKTVRKSTKLSDTPENRKLIVNELLPKFEAKLLLGQVQETKNVKPFEYYATEYLDSKQYLKSFKTTKIKVNQILPHFKGEKIDSIKRSDVKSFINMLLKRENIKPKTVRNTLTVLSGIFDIAVDEEVVKENVCKNIKLPANNTYRPEPFKEEEIPLILNTIEEDWFRCFVATGFYTGMRTGEIIGLKIGDIDFNRGVIHVRRNVVDGNITTTKTAGSVRDIPLFDKLVSFLKDQIGDRIEGFIFTTPQGNHYYGSDVISAFRWKKVLNTLGLKYRRLYTTRHTFITAMLRSGKFSVMEIAKIVGHTNTHTILINYAQIIEGEQLKISRSFDPFNS